MSSVANSSEPHKITHHNLYFTIDNNSNNASNNIKLLEEIG